MVDPVQSSLAEAAQALLAGRPLEARARYEACAPEVPRLAALGLAITAWSQGDFLALRARVARALEGGEDGAFPGGFAQALEGLAAVHAGEIVLGLARQAAGIAAARQLGDGAELNAVVARIDALLALGRLDEAGATIAAVRPLAAAEDAPLALMMLDRLALALAVSADAPEAEALADAAVRASRARADDVGLAWALRWRGAWLAGRRPAEAAADLDAAVGIAARHGLHLVAGEALLLLAGIDAPQAAGGRLAAARMHARASGSALAELAVELRLGGQAAAAAEARLETLTAPLDPADRAALLRRAGGVRPPDPAAPAGPTAPTEVGRVGAILTAIAAQPDLAGVLETALAAFVAVAEAERGFLLRLAGFEVIDQVIHGAAPDAYSHSLADRVAWSGEPLVIADLETEAELREAASVRELGLRTAFGVPLRDGGEVVGVMLADSREPHRGYDAATLALGGAIADHVVVAVRNAERAERHRAGEAAEAALGRAALAAARAPTLEAALPALAAEAAATLGAERLFIHLGDDLTCRAACDAAGRPLPDARPSLGAVRWVADHGRPLVVVDAHAAAAFAERPSVRELALRAIHAHPLMVDGRPRGVLYLDSGTPVDERPQDARVLAGLASIAAALIAREAAT